ncbi:MAG: DUF4350 domain-containing protein [Gemmatimonadales bacterium]
MRPRTELAVALGLGLLVAAGIAVDAFNARGPRELGFDRSTYLASPTGARAWFEALRRLGVDVRRWRAPVAAVPGGFAGRPAPLLAILDPLQPITFFEALELQQWSLRRGDLLLAGQGTDLVMRCFGWEIAPAILSEGVADLKASGTIGPTRLSIERIHAVLHPTRLRIELDSSRVADLGLLSCPVRQPLGVDTLLWTPSGAPVAVRIRVDSLTNVTLVADGHLFSNSALRESDAGPFTLGLVVPDYRMVYVDEYHQGYHGDRSLSGAVLGWSIHSPWGWGAWQLAIVGLLALFAAGIRFGPIVSGIERRRRSPIEHVRALATALAAARGHDVAVRLMIQGLRRRLSRDHRPRRQPVEEWLASLAAGVRTARAREAIGILQESIIPPQSADAVLRAAHAVEDVWLELKP